MDTESRQNLQARIREIDEWLRDLEACEMTEGWVSYGPDNAELAQAYEQRKQLVKKLAAAA